MSIVLHVYSSATCNDKRPAVGECGIHSSGDPTKQRLLSLTQFFKSFWESFRVQRHKADTPRSRHLHRRPESRLHRCDNLLGLDRRFYLCSCLHSPSSLRTDELRETKRSPNSPSIWRRWAVLRTRRRGILGRELAEVRTAPDQDDLVEID